MTETNDQGLVKIRRALISVSNKTGIVEFAHELKRFGVKIISTGGTAKTLRDAGLEVRDVSDVTGFPEMMDGRIKTLHPKIHGALLSVRNNPEHVAAMREHDIEPIDLVVISLYPFEETIAREGVTLAEAIEQIDIGGPAMIRSAAKNHESVTVVVSPDEYPNVLNELRLQHGSISSATRRRLALQAFRRTATYDAIVSVFLQRSIDDKDFPDSLKSSHGPRIGSFAVGLGGPQQVSIETASEPPDLAQWVLRKTLDLRYGENPHQVAALYDTNAPAGVATAELLSGKEMSFNNYVDADAAWQLVCDFDELACAIIKHTNPAGMALGVTAEEAYRNALACDPVSAFGGIVAFNAAVDAAAARAITEIFVEVIIAPEYEPATLDVLKTKKNLRVLRAGEPKSSEGLEYKHISGGMLVQARDSHRLKREDLKVVTKRAPSEKEVDDLLFAWMVCKHTKSNAIVYARDKQTVGVGAGQMSRVISVQIACEKAGEESKASVLASDAFFPFPDGLEAAGKSGITAVAQPGGSVKDADVIAAADAMDIAMVMTGFRHFRH